MKLIIGSILALLSCASLYAMDSTCSGSGAPELLIEVILKIYSKENEYTSYCPELKTTTISTLPMVKMGNVIEALWREANLSNEDKKNIRWVPGRKDYLAIKDEDDLPLLHNPLNNTHLPISRWISGPSQVTLAVFIDQPLVNTKRKCLLS